MGCEALSDVAIWVKSKGAVTCCGQGTHIDPEWAGEGAGIYCGAGMKIFWPT